MENKKSVYSIIANEGLTNSQSYLRDTEFKEILSTLNFEKRFKNVLSTEDIEASRIDFAYLMSDIFTHYRNVRSNKKDEAGFFEIGNEFMLVLKK